MNELGEESEDWGIEASLQVCFPSRGLCYLSVNDPVNLGDEEK